MDALIPVAAGASGFKPEGENDPVEAAWKEIEEAFKKRDIPRAVELSTRLWTDGPIRTPGQVNAAVRERVKAMTTHNYERPDDENAPQPQELDLPALARLSEIHVPTLIIVGDADVRDILVIADKLEAGIAGAQKAVIPNTAHHLNMEEPAAFNQIVLDFLRKL